MNATVISDCACDLEQYRPYLVRFARAKITDTHIVEDLVQDTLLAAMTARSPFLGRSALRTWLTGILNHKIVDVYRLATLEKSRRLTAPASDEIPADWLAQEESLHAAREAETRQGLIDPIEEVERRQLASSLTDAIRSLPPRQRDAFVLVHMHGHSGEEAARRIGVTNSNLWIILHRTRKMLQSQLQMQRMHY
ncbi:MAG: sigma-70 family RNA polymerase sigma factor [Betaproteobacteria bacterium]